MLSLATVVQDTELSGRLRLPRGRLEAAPQSSFTVNTKCFLVFNFC